MRKGKSLARLTFFIPKTFLKVGLEASVNPLELSARLMTQREVVKGLRLRCTHSIEA